MRTVIVTGASRGIGEAVVRCLRADGVRVIGVARSADPLRMLSQEKLGPGPMEFIVGDVSDQKVLLSAVDLAVSNGQHSLVGVVLNAAVLQPISRITDLDIVAVRQHFDVNVFSQMELVKMALPHLRKSSGRIVLVTSGIVEHPMSGWAAYAAAKSAMNSFVGTLAREEHGIIAVGVRPGLVDTRMVRESRETGKDVMDEESKAWMEEMRKTNSILQPSVPGTAIAKLVQSAPKELSGKCIAWDDERVPK